MKCKPHFFLYAPLWFTFPNSENIPCKAGMKPNFFVYNNVMAGPGMTPEKTCIHILLNHRLLLQRQSKCSAFTYGHCGLCWVASAAVTHIAGADVNVTVDKKCARMAAVLQQLRGDFSISPWLTQEQKCFNTESKWLTQR